MKDKQTVTGTWTVCPYCNHCKRFKRTGTKLITDTIRKVYVTCRGCGGRFDVLEEKRLIVKPSPIA